MLDTTKLTTQENIFLSEEITVVAPLATPLMTLLLGKGKQKQGSAKIHTWREKSLDFGNATILEGADPKAFVNSTRAELNNVMEIFAKATSVSGTAQATGSVKDLFSFIALLILLKACRATWLTAITFGFPFTLALNSPCLICSFILAI